MGLDLAAWKGGKRGGYLETRERAEPGYGRKVAAHNSVIMARCGGAFNRSESKRASSPSRRQGSVE